MEGREVEKELQRNMEKERGRGERMNGSRKRRDGNIERGVDE